MGGSIPRMGPVWVLQQCMTVLSLKMLPSLPRLVCFKNGMFYCLLYWYIKYTRIPHYPRVITSNMRIENLRLCMLMFSIRLVIAKLYFFWLFIRVYSCPVRSQCDVSFSHVHSCQQKSIGLKCSKFQTGNDVRVQLPS